MRKHLCQYLVGSALGALLIAAVGCKESKKGPSVEESYGIMMQGYSSTNIHVAEQALLDYRTKLLNTTNTKGVNIGYLLGLTEARLFVVSKQLGDSSRAEIWFNSSVSNFNRHKRITGGPQTDSSKPELEALVSELEKSVPVAWRTNR
jgi:hypothetical protein